MALTREEKLAARIRYIPAQPEECGPHRELTQAEIDAAVAELPKLDEVYLTAELNEEGKRAFAEEAGQKYFGMGINAVSAALSKVDSIGALPPEALDPKNPTITVPEEGNYAIAIARNVDGVATIVLQEANPTPDRLQEIRREFFPELDAGPTFAAPTADQLFRGWLQSLEGAQVIDPRLPNDYGRLLGVLEDNARKAFLAGMEAAR